MSNKTCFPAKAGETLIVQLSTQHFDCSESTKVNMPTKVDLSKAAFSQQLDELIIAELFSDAVRHSLSLSENDIHIANEMPQVRLRYTRIALSKGNLTST